ncbi:MAG: cobalamin-dependent protein [Anaerolineales bacterium]|nr:cobalamin-dependent protein [Anaerolineales bacterium]
MTNLENTDIRKALIANVSDLKEQEAMALVQERVERGHNPLTIVEDCQEGLRQVGERYEKREYFLAGLIMAGEIFRQVMEILQPIIEDKLTGNETGTILLGTVKGDIHDIGKNNISMLLVSYGFTVHDLGIDVPPSEFLLQALQVKPNIIGLSGLLTSSYDAMKETIALIRNSGEGAITGIPIIVGGNQITEQVCEYVGADYWVNDAMTGVRLCESLLAKES